ncbi:MAG: hypothetical protein AAF546_00240 [Verrucomicrobiota bacterium]
MQRAKYAQFLFNLGADWPKALHLAGYPSITSISWTSEDPSIDNFGNKPDDDFRIIVGGDTLADQRRVVNEYSRAYYAANQPVAKSSSERLGLVIEIGKTFQIQIIDLKESFFSLKKWRLDLAYSNQSKRSVFGGANFVGNSAEATNQEPVYYDNGGCVLPPPPEWDMPAGLMPDSGQFEIAATGTRAG